MSNRSRGHRIHGLQLFSANISDTPLSLSFVFRGVYSACTGESHIGMLLCLVTFQSFISLQLHKEYIFI